MPQLYMGVMPHILEYLVAYLRYLNLLVSVHFCGKSLAPKGKLIEPEYKQIDESDIKVGDYICIDGESSFCSFGRHIIADILTKYDEDTG